MDTIVALATPSGRSAIGVIRMSGPNALTIVRSLVNDEQFSPEPTHTVLRDVFNPTTNELIDRSLITYFRKPHSFTGEDVIEISSHGSPVVLRNMVDSILRLEARLAGPGEFTLRSLRNGKMNLSQAEGIRDLINAQTDAAARQAVRQLRGELSNRLQPLKDRLVAVIVLLESALEFVEDDLPSIRARDLQNELTELLSEVNLLATTFNSGHLLRDGLKVTIAGRPNVGKSSLFNKLVQMDRSIVTEIPGTTRDTVSEQITIKGVPVVLTDTAGVRESSDRIERMGVERTHQAMADADLVLAVVDGTTKSSHEDQEILDGMNQIKLLIALNKSDLPSYNPDLSVRLDSGSRVVQVSGKTGAGLEELQRAILEPFTSFETNDGGLLITDARHYDLLRRICSELESSRRLFHERASEELVLVGLYNALRLLGEITGETTAEDVLSKIFSTFCIGK